MSVEWLALNSVNGLGPVRIARLIERFGSPGAVFGQPADLLVRECGLPAEVARTLRDASLLDEARIQADRARDSGVTILTLDDARYPALLREIFAPPPVLFVKGDPSVFGRHAVAVVGTRRPTQYGRDAAAALTRGLAAKNVAIVSGLALGIDTVAHEACLEAGGITIAVLGCSIDAVYPPSNERLAGRILERGALVSEFNIGMPAMTFNFPRRNRIISGCAAGTLVVEAGVRSGALITSTYALQQGRDVFAVPGPIFADKSVGTFNLIRNGATPVRTADDILDAITAVTLRTGRASDQGPVVASIVEEQLSDREKTVVRFIADTPRRMDQLIEGCDIPVGELFDLLLNLELKGVLKQAPGQTYTRAH